MERATGSSSESASRGCEGKEGEHARRVIGVVVAGGSTTARSAVGGARPARLAVVSVKTTLKRAKSRTGIAGRL
jgi:hypothetical protein